MPLHDSLSELALHLSCSAAACGSSPARQVLGTKGKIGYLIAEIDTENYDEAKAKMLDLPNSIRIRIL